MSFSRSFSLMGGGVLGLALAAAVPFAAASAEVAIDQLVEAQASFAPAGTKLRLSGAKGVCLTGQFTPTPDAAALSKAGHFNRPVDVIGRFSMGGGNPRISDKTKPVTRGFSLRFDLGGGSNTDLVLISAPVFGVKSAEQMFEGFKARMPGPGGTPADPAKIKAFTDANPEVLRQAAWLNARPVPASFATVNYWGVHGFVFTNAAGKSTIAKLKTIPAAGEVGLSEDELKAKPDNFYADDLKTRLAAGPIRFDLVAVPTEAGDPGIDITQVWPNEEGRKTTKLGTIAIAAIAPDATCDAFTFDPVNVPDGFSGQPGDTMFEIRSPAYAISLTRRSN